MPALPTAAPRAKEIAAAVACAALLAWFAIASWRAVLTKSATIDEPLDTVAAWATASLHDLRLGYDAPPLTQYWAGLPQRRSAFTVDPASSQWRQILGDESARQWWVLTALYEDPHLDPVAAVNRSRAMMLVLAVLLGAATAAWAWRLGGPVAGVVATGFFAFDPNFLAHAPLVKSDVAACLAFLLTAAALQSVGRRVTWPRVLALGLACGVALNVKFSCVLVVPMVVVVLGARAMLPWEWPVYRRTLRAVPDKFWAAAGAGAAAALIAAVVTWACYGFRNSVSPDAAARIDFRSLIDSTARNEIQASHPDLPVVEAELQYWRPGMTVSTILWIRRSGLLPEPWLAGLLYQYQNTRVWPAYLCGRIGRTGWWYYFPLAMLFKTAAATLAAVAAATALAAWLIVRRRRSIARSRAWAAIALALPPAVYGLWSLTANADIGIRHVLPLYPFLYIAIGWVVATLVRSGGAARAAAVAGASLLVVALAVESTAAAPDYLAFFNVMCGGSRGGVRLLSDSNIDWGQDLPALADWQRAHPEAGPLYLAYWGSAYPEAYGIRYEMVPGGYRRRGEPVTTWPSAPGVLAVSVVRMHGQYFHSEEARRTYRALTQGPPLAVLGGSIYLFPYDPARVPPP